MVIDVETIAYIDKSPCKYFYFFKDDYGWYFMISEYGELSRVALDDSGICKYKFVHSISRDKVWLYHYIKYLDEHKLCELL